MIVTDLDDTLLNDKGEISERNLKALLHAQEKGILVVPVSGRSHYGIQKTARQLKLEEHHGYLISFNGARIFDHAEKKELYASNVSHEDGRVLYEFAMKYGVELHTYHDKEIVATGENRYTCFEADFTGMEVDYPKDFLEEIKQYPTVKYVMSGEPEHLRKIAKEIHGQIPGRLHMSFTKPFFLEFFDSNTDKGTSALKLAQMLGIPREEIISFGDSYNDISMIEKAGFGVAMENAVEEAKNVADHITGSNEKDGVAMVVEKFCLGAGEENGYEERRKAVGPGKSTLSGCKADEEEENRKAAGLERDMEGAAALLENILDVIKEEQIKLGYQREKIRLYYPLASLNQFFKSTDTVSGMHRRLVNFSANTREKLGGIQVSNEGERFCLCIPEEGAEYVHRHIPQNDFLCQLVELVRGHGVKIEQVLELFFRTGSKVHFEQTAENDFLLYFEDGVPDKYYYCFTQDEFHMIYHRFRKEDYEALG